MNREIDCRWVKTYLGVDETVLWSGKPGKGHLLTRADIFMIPFSILWCSFAIFWEASVLSEGAPWPFKLFGIPFVLVGLYITVGRFVHKVYIRKRTEYVITNQRFLRLRGKKVDTVEVQSKDQINVTINKDGSGTIFLAPPVLNDYQNMTWSGAGVGFQLENIEDVSHVREIILTMGQQA